MSIIDEFRVELQNREITGRYRQLRKERQGIDFFSNDYLGFARNEEFKARLHALVLQYPESILGATGSRLISGNSDLQIEIEQFIANQHGFESALLFPAGYNANLALFSTLPKKFDTILLDEKVHRSVYDGCRLSPANRWKFRHNNLDHLEELLKKATGHIWVGIESLYSMDGDFAPIQDIAALCEHYSAALIVDEAHAIGTCGLGLVDHFGLQNQVFATVITYGKAMGLSGASILGSSSLIAYLINYSSTFIYTTGMPDFHALAIKASYDFLKDNELLINGLQTNVKQFHPIEEVDANPFRSPIIPIRFPDTRDLEKAVELLEKQRILSYAIKHPTVPKEEEMLRISIHSFNTKEEIGLLKNSLEEIKNE